MHSQRSTIKAFTDAAADAVAREIATIRREAQREREVRDAEYRARLAELDARISSTTDLERRLADRLASLKDGRDGVDGRDGAPGRDGERGADGVDGKDGRDGVDGKDGASGRDGERGADGVAGKDGRDGVDGKDGVPGRDGERGADGVDGKDGRDGNPGRDGTDGLSVTVADVEPVIVAEVERVLAAWPRPKDGASVTLDDVAPLIERAVGDAVAAIPPAKDGRDGAAGKDADPDIVRAMVDEAVAALPPAERGPPGERGEKGETGERGPAGALPLIKDWSDRVHYAGEVVSHEGSTWQASRDTGRAPPHDDWTCIASSGRDGVDGRSFTVRGTFSTGQTYAALDVVALNGAAFVARRDDPGACPGEGWQMISAQGKRGQAGERGAPGAKGEVGARGEPGQPVVAMSVDGEGLLTTVNADGSIVTCDLYPLLASLG